MARRNFPNKLLVKSNEYEKQKPIQTTGELVEIIKTSQLPQEEKAGILQKEFSSCADCSK
jgi:hypothetical protein